MKGPRHKGHIGLLGFELREGLFRALLKVAADDELYASYFWWKDFYEVRNSRADLSQSFCALCAALHGDQEAKVYSDLTKWWVTQSRCKKLHLN